MNKNSIFASLEKHIDQGKRFSLGRQKEHHYYPQSPEKMPEEKLVYYCYDETPDTKVGKSEFCIEDAILSYFEINGLKG